MRVLVVEDDDQIRSAYARVLNRAGYVLAEAKSLEQAWSVVRAAAPIDAAVLDVTLSDGCATSLVEPLLDRDPLCKSVIVTGHGGWAPELLRSGAHEFVRKPVTGIELVHAVQRTLRATRTWRQCMGQGALAPAPPSGPVASSVSVDLDAAARRLRYLGNLTPTQTLIAWRLLWGDRQQRIAEMLGCSTRTVKYHVTGLLARIGARSRSDLVRVLVEDAGIEDPFKVDVAES